MTGVRASSAREAPAAERRGTVDHALAELRRGRPVVLTGGDGADVDLVCAAEFADAEAINFMATHARGLIRLALPPDRCDALGLAPMAPGREGGRADFTVSIEARDGVTTGISAADRARTIAVATDPRTCPPDLVRPGHVFPVRAAADGVLARAGSAEAALDLARLAGLTPAAVLCQVLDDEGHIAAGTALDAFCARHGVAALEVDELVAHRRREERSLPLVLDVTLPSRYGHLRVAVFHDRIGGGHRLALALGDLAGVRPALVRLHTDCSDPGLLADLRCRCGRSFDAPLSEIAAAGGGVLLCLAATEDPAALRDAHQILADLGAVADLRP